MAKELEILKQAHPDVEAMYEKLRKADLEIELLKERLQKKHRMLVKWQWESPKQKGRWTDFPQCVSDKIEVSYFDPTYGIALHCL